MFEIGPGLGTLTRAIAATGARVIAIERDRGLAEVLAETVGEAEGVEVIFEDATKFDYGRALDDRGAGRAVVVANLPYQIATGLVLAILESEPRVVALDVMVQKEAGERLVAAPGSDAYGAVSVKVAALADARISYRVSKKVFLPEPEVESVMVRLDRLKSPRSTSDLKQLWRVVEAGFAQRRKTLRRALRGGGFEQGKVEEALEAAGIDGTIRAEQLALDEFDRLAQHLFE